MKEDIDQDCSNPINEPLLNPSEMNIPIKLDCDSRFDKQKIKTEGQELSEKQVNDVPTIPEIDEEVPGNEIKSSK